MGKIRVTTFGDDKAEKKQKIKAEKRKEAKKADKGPENTELAVVQQEEKKKAMQKKGIRNSSKRIISKRHKENEKMVDENKTYALSDAIQLLEKMKPIKFDETVELHINTVTKGVSGSLILPHGTGKSTRVAIISPAKDAKAAEELIAQISTGKIMFDVLIATPDAMPKLAKVAKILGPRGLMPNPKSGTVTTNPDEAAKKYEGGQMNFKTESKHPLLHLTVGKISFGKDKLEENITTTIKAVQPKNIKNATLKSTMSAGIRIQVA